MKSKGQKKDPAERFALLGDNVLSVVEGTDAEARLFETIEGYFQASRALEIELRDTRFALYVLAASLRRKYLDPKTHKYDADFRSWFFKRRPLTDREHFGRLSNFVKFAKVGELVHYIASNSENAEADLAKLPLNLAALYQIHIVRERLLFRAKENRIFWQLFESTPTRKSLTDNRPKLNRPALIHPEVRAEEIQRWRHSWENPSEAEDVETREFTIPIATIYAHKSMFEFDKRSGDHKGAVKLSDLKEYLRQLDSLTAKNKKRFRIDDKLTELEDRFAKLSNEKTPSK
jgi:hypothetical protein